MNLNSLSFFGALLSLTAATAPVALTTPATAEPVQVQVPAPADLPIPPVQTAEADPEPATPPSPATDPAPSPDARHVACVAKVILHEAAYEPRPGRVAVAQVIRARIRSGRFAPDACAVTRQRGQFFNVDAFDPPHNAAWDDAMAIAHETLTGGGEDVVPGALFFHASYSPMPGHARVGQIGGHVFYR